MDEEKQRKNSPAGTRGNDGGGLIWIVGAIGAAVYYVQQAESVGRGALGIVKAFVWPAILTYKALEFLSR